MSKPRAGFKTPPSDRDRARRRQARSADAGDTTESIVEEARRSITPSQPVESRRGFETGSRILVVEDEPQLARTLKENLDLEGYQAEIAPDGERALEMLRSRVFHLVILDLLLPGKSGFDVCEELRKCGERLPVLMLTALGETHQKIRGLEIGADDYLTKPFSLGELLARVKALLRRASGEGFREPAYRFPGGEIEFDSYQVKRGRQVFHLAHTEREILRLLVSRPGEPIRRSEFLDVIWGIEAFPTDRTVDNYIVKLRRKVERDPARPCRILTVHGVGYKFVP